MPESANKEEIVLLSKWEELISQTNIVPLKKEDEEIPQYTITIQQPEGATITVALDGTNHTETFDADKGSVYTVSLSGDNARYLVPNTEGGKLTDNVTISATDYRSDPIPERCAIIILQDSAEDQIIRAHVTNMDGNGNDGITDYRNSVWVSPGAKAEFYLEIPFQRKWDPGKLNVEVLDPVTKNVNYVYATPPIIRSDFDPTIVIVTVIQVPHMTIHIWVTPPGGGAETEYTSSFNPKIGSTYRITTTMESDWYEGGMVSFPLAGSFTQDCTITGRSPEMVYFTVHIIQSAHQTITVSCNGDTSDFKAKPESTFNVSVQADVGYCDGDPNYRSGTILSDITISAQPVVAYREKFDLLIGEGWTEGGLGPFVGFSAWNFDDFHYGDISPRTWIDEVNYDRYATPAGGGMSVKGAWSPTMVLKGWHFYFPDGTYIRCAANAVRPGTGDNDGFPIWLNATAIRDKMLEYMGKWITFYLFY